MTRYSTSIRRTRDALSPALSPSRPPTGPEPSRSDDREPSSRSPLSVDPPIRATTSRIIAPASSTTSESSIASSATSRKARAAAISSRPAVWRCSVPRSTALPGVSDRSSAELVLISPSCPGLGGRARAELDPQCVVVHCGPAHRSAAQPRRQHEVPAIGPHRDRQLLAVGVDQVDLLTLDVG